jgi:hypothetical protein
MGARLLAGLGTPESAIALLRRGINEALEVRTAAASTVPAEAGAATAGGLDSGSSSSSSHDGGVGGDSGAAAASSGGGVRLGGKRKKARPQVELFVLDPKHAHGLPSAAAAAQPGGADGLLPCGDCPLVRQGFDAADAAALASFTGGEEFEGQLDSAASSSADSDEEEVAGSSSSDLVPVSASIGGSGSAQGSNSSSSVSDA